MKQVAFCASLMGVLLLFPKRGVSKELLGDGFPLMWFASLQSEAYQREKDNDGEIQQQHQLYVGTSLKPMPSTWFHLGFKSRLTNTTMLEEPYKEPVSAYLSLSHALIDKYLYLSGVMSLPILNSKASLKDSNSIYHLTNDQSLLFEPNIVPLNTLGAGLHFQKSWDYWFVKGGGRYFKSSSYELYKGHKNFPSSFSVLRLQISLIQKKIFQQVEGKVTFFGAEKDRNQKDREAHQEGRLLQVRYLLRTQGKNKGREMNFGGRWKEKDKSRLALDSKRITEESSNSNIQKLYFRYTLVQPQNRNFLLSISLMPQLLYQESTEAIGYQTNLGFMIKLSPATSQFVTVSGELLFGKLEETQFFGGRINLSFSHHRKRRLGSGLFPQKKTGGFKSGD